LPKKILSFHLNLFTKINDCYWCLGKYDYSYHDTFYHGVNVVAEQLVDEIQKFNGKRVLIVTTNSLLSTKAYKSMIESLHKNEIKTFITCSKQHVPGTDLMKEIKSIHHLI
jgi:alcohol dehydrogenase class IV